MTADAEICGWAMQSVLEQRYHDEEWGVPCVDDDRLFEFLVLESAQAGLSWRTVLQKRDAYRRHYRGFDARQVAGFGETEIQAMLADPGMIRNRAKIEASINNARVFLQLQARHGRFARYLWGFVDGQPLCNHWQRQDQVPATTALSKQLARELKAAGMRFFGPTIAYAYLQAVGVVNDHIVSCPRHQACKALATGINPETSPGGH